MNITVCVGGNKTISGVRLGTKLADTLQAQGNKTNIFAAKGQTIAAASVPFKEYSSLTSAKTLANWLAQNKTNAVISIMNLRACEAAVLAGLPFVYVEYENFKEDKSAKNKKSLLQKAARVLVLSDKNSPLNSKIYSKNAMRVSAPALWVEHQNNQKPACFKKANNIVAVGDLSKDGGFNTLLETWAKLAPAHQTWHLTLVGDGTQKAAFQRFINKNNLQASTEIISAKNDVFSLLGNADIFAYPAVNPSRADELLDAMASKLPCVACQSPAADALINNGVNGVLVNAQSEAFTSALDDMMVNWGKRVGIAVEASKLKDKYPFSAFIKAIEDVLA